MLSPIEMGAVVWSPRGLGSGGYPYAIATKAPQFHVDSSLWVGAWTQGDFNSIKALTPRVGLFFNPALDSATNALMVDVVTGQSMKPHWFNFNAAWFGCVNRSAFLNSVANRIREIASWGATDVHMDDLEVNYQLSSGGSYLYGTGNVVGTLGNPARGCFCSECQAKASSIGYGALNSSTIQAFAKISVTNFWSVIGTEARSNLLLLSGNLRYDRELAPAGYSPGRLHYPMVEEYGSDATGDGTITAWERYAGQFVGTYATNTQASPEQAFGASDRTRRWMALRYAIGALPIAPWDVYAGSGVNRVFAARQDVADLFGFVRAKAVDLFHGFSLASAVGESKRWPLSFEAAAWADTTNVFVTVRYRDSDGKRVIHAVDLRDTPASFNLSWWGGVVGGGAVTEYRPAAYLQATHDAAIASGNRSTLVSVSSPSVTGSGIRTAAMSAALWRVLEVTP